MKGKSNGALEKKEGEERRQKKRKWSQTGEFSIEKRKKKKINFREKWS